MVTLILAFYMAIANRIRGRRHGKELGLTMLAAPFAYMTYSIIQGVNWWGPALVFAWVWVWLRTGHADGFRGPYRDNFLSPISKFIAKLFKISRTSYTYDAIFWTIKGIAVSAGLPLVIYNTPYILPSTVLTISYLLVCILSFPLGYLLGYKIASKLPTGNQHRWYNSGIVWGEILSGFGMGLAVAIL